MPILKQLVSRILNSNDVIKIVWQAEKLMYKYKDILFH